MISEIFLKQLELMKDSGDMKQIKTRLLDLEERVSQLEMHDKDAWWRQQDSDVVRQQQESAIAQLSLYIKTTNEASRIMKHQIETMNEGCSLYRPYNEMDLEGQEKPKKKLRIYVYPYRNSKSRNFEYLQVIDDLHESDLQTVEVHSKDQFKDVDVFLYDSRAVDKPVGLDYFDGVSMKYDINLNSQSKGSIYWIIRELLDLEEKINE